MNKVRKKENHNINYGMIICVRHMCGNKCTRIVHVHVGYTYVQRED